MVLPSSLRSSGGAGAAIVAAAPKNAYAKYVLQNPALMQQVSSIYTSYRKKKTACKDDSLPAERRDFFYYLAHLHVQLRQQIDGRVHHLLQYCVSVRTPLHVCLNSRVSYIKRRLLILIFFPFSLFC